MPGVSHPGPGPAVTGRGVYAVLPHPTTAPATFPKGSVDGFVGRVGGGVRPHRIASRSVRGPQGRPLYPQRLGAAQRGIHGSVPDALLTLGWHA